MSWNHLKGGWVGGGKRRLERVRESLRVDG